MDLKTSTICASAHLSDNSAHKKYSAIKKQNIFCAPTIFRRKPSRICSNSSGFQFVLALFLAAAFVLVSCNEPFSSSSAKPKTKQEALADVGNARQALQTTVEKEADAKIAYVKADGKEKLAWRLLRRIVFMGNTPAIRKKLLEAWKAARAVTKREETKLQNAIDALKSAGGAEQAKKIEQSFVAFQAAVETMRKATIADITESSDAIKARLTQATTAALGEIETAKDEALEAIKKAEKGAIDRITEKGKEIEERLEGWSIDKIISRMDISDAIVLYREQQKIWYKIVKDGDKFTKQYLLPETLKRKQQKEYGSKINIYSYNVLKDYLLFHSWDEDNDEEKYYLVRKSDNKAFALDGHMGRKYKGRSYPSALQYSGGYVYYSVDFSRKTEIRRFQPGSSPQTVATVNGTAQNFFVDTEGNLLTDFSLYSGGQKTELKIGNKAISWASQLIRGKDGKIYLVSEEEPKMRFYVWDATKKKFVPKGNAFDINFGSNPDNNFKQNFGLLSFFHLDGEKVASSANSDWKLYDFATAQVSSISGLPTSSSNYGLASIKGSKALYRIFYKSSQA